MFVFKLLKAGVLWLLKAIMGAFGLGACFALIGAGCSIVYMMLAAMGPGLYALCASIPLPGPVVIALMLAILMLGGWVANGVQAGQSQRQVDDERKAENATEKQRLKEWAIGNRERRAEQQNSYEEWAGENTGPKARATFKTAAPKKAAAVRSVVITNPVHDAQNDSADYD